jgi:hypothetical protein
MVEIDLTAQRIIMYRDSSHRVAGINTTNTFSSHKSMTIIETLEKYQNEPHRHQDILESGMILLQINSKLNIQTIERWY